MIQEFLRAAISGGILLVASSGLASGQTVISIAGNGITPIRGMIRFVLIRTVTQHIGT